MIQIEQRDGERERERGNGTKRGSDWKELWEKWSVRKGNPEMIVVGVWVWLRVGILVADRGRICGWSITTI